MMRRSRTRVILLLLLLGSSSCAWQNVSVSNVAVRRGRDGAIVGAQDGNLLELPAVPAGGDAFALIGMLYGDCIFAACANETDGACGFGAGRITVWTSASLADMSWSGGAEVLPAAQRPPGIYFRPHIVYNARTRRFVLWVRWLAPTSGSLAAENTTYLTATAEELRGPYTVARRNVSMFWPNSADDSLFVDEDGAAYIVHTARSTGTAIVVERLTEDYTACAGASDPAARSALIGPGHSEAPAMWRLGARYYVSFAPLCCYCTEGAPTEVWAADAPLGPYAPAGALGNAPRAQQNFAFSSSRLQGVLWGGNRWGSDPLSPAAPIFDRSLQFWQTLRFAANGSALPLQWSDEATLAVNVALAPGASSLGGDDEPQA